MELLEKHFEIALETPDGIKKLRELILSLAMQGKLVPQDSNDEPASELLKEIAIEQKKLAKEGKIKNSGRVSYNVDKKPYKIPQTWEWVGIQECYFSIGTKNNQVQTNDYLGDGKYPIIDQGKSFIAGYSNLNTKVIKLDNPVIVFGDHTKNIKYVDFDFIIGADGVKVLNPFSPILPKYFYYVIKSYDLADRGYARHFKILNERFVPLAPFPEQKRIVSKIEQLMILCAKLETERNERNSKRTKVHNAAINKLLTSSDKPEFKKSWNFITKNFNELYSVPENVEELKKAILHLAVMGKLVSQDPKDQPASELLKVIESEKNQLVKEGKVKKQEQLPPIEQNIIPYEIPENWQWVKMGEICFDITSGSTPSQNIFSCKEGIPFLKVYNIRNQRIDFNYKPQFIKTEYHKDKQKRSILYPGDVIMNIVGPPLGKVAIIPEDYKEWNCNQAIVFFRPIIKQLNSFIYHYLMAGTFLKDIELIGTAGQDNISVTKSKNILIPLPPLAEQKRIVAKIDEIMGLCNNLQQQIIDSTKKKTAILNSVMQNY